LKFSMRRQEKGDPLIQVTAWEGLTVYQYRKPGQVKYSSL